MSDILRIAVKEFRDGLRNRWVAACVLLLAALGLAISLVGQAPSGGVGGDPLSIVVVSLASLSVYLLPLIALMLAHDAFAGELERGTLILLLSYPISRWQIVVGKLLGHVAILSFAIVLGFGLVAAVEAAFSDPGVEGWIAFAVMCGSSTLLGAVFVAIGYVISVAFDERAKAAGFAVATWLVLVVLYDLGVLGLLLADTDQSISETTFALLMLVNPTDAFRIFNLTLLQGVREVAGLAGLAVQGPGGTGMPLVALTAWLLVPLGLAVAVFSRREL
jgi:Cu-processing system permease protein